MKIFDVHIHAKNTVPDPEGLIRKMDNKNIMRFPGKSGDEN